MRLTRLLAAAALVLPVLSHVGASAADQTATRTEQSSYSAPGGTAIGGGAPVLLSPGASLAAKPSEDRVRVTAADRTGRPVMLAIDVVPTGSTATTTRVVCGTSPSLAIAAGSSVRVTPLAGTCPDGSPSAPTSGTITVSFLRPVVPPGVPAARRWAVVVGIQDYAGNTHSTYGGRGDVTAIRGALLRSGWRSDHIRTLVDGEATGQAVIDAMAWLAERSGPDTFSLFHFSGHVCIASRGPCASGHTYLWGYDNSFVPEATVGAVLGRVQGGAWFDFAGCESGAFDAGLHSAKRLVTGSSQASETSYEQPEWRESVWTGLVWDQAFLQGRAGPKPGRATIGQMVAYGRSQAPRVTSGQAAGPQHPYVAGGDPTSSLYAPKP